MQLRPLEIEPRRETIDPTRPLRLAGGDPVLARDLLRLHLARMPDRVRRLTEALGEDDPGGATRAAHSIAASARAVGAIEVGCVAEGIEDAAWAHDMRTARALNDALMSAIHAFGQTVR